MFFALHSKSRRGGCDNKYRLKGIRSYLCIDTITTLQHNGTMEALRHNNISTVTLDVRISCDTFWNYKFNIPIRINDYYDQNARNIHRGGAGGTVNTDTCRIGNIGNRDPLFNRLEDYLVEYVIQQIYDDLVIKRHHRDVLILLKKARKFHIHGRTLEDILFPNRGGIHHGGTTAVIEHAMPENTVYICTHG